MCYHNWPHQERFFLVVADFLLLHSFSHFRLLKQKDHRIDSLKSAFLIVPEAVKSKIKGLAELLCGEGRFPN